MVMIQPAVETFYNLVCGIFINLENWVAGEERLGATTIQLERIFHEPWNTSHQPGVGKFKSAQRDIFSSN